MRLTKTRLTAERVNKFVLPPGKAQAFLRDAEVSGLAVRVSSGSKSYIFESKLNRRTVRTTIGDAKVWPLDDARKESRRLQTLVDRGIDPRSEKQARLKALESSHQASRIALEIWNDYLAAHASSWSISHTKDHEKVATEGGTLRVRGRRPNESERTKPGILYPILNRPLTDITPSLVDSWLRKEAKVRPTHTRLAFSLLRAFLNWCSETPEYGHAVNKEACTSNKARKLLPKKGVKTDCLQREQLELWFDSVLKLDNPTIKAYLQALLITGARKNEISRLLWSDIDFKWNSLTIHDKTEGERTIPLTPYLAEQLLILKRINDTPPPSERLLTGKWIKNDLENWKPSRWVFRSGISKSGHIEDGSSAHKRALAVAGISGLTIHGLRRSFKSLSEWVEVPAGVVAQIMGHKPSALVEKHYTVRPLDLLRVWHTRIESWMLNEAGLTASTHLQDQHPAMNYPRLATQKTTW